MTPLPPVPGAIKSNLHWAIEGNVLAENILHFAYTGGPPSAGDCAAIATELVSVASAHMNALVASSVAMNQAEVTDLSSDMGATAFGGVTWDGTRGTDLVPPGACAVASHQIARRYRGGHPRTYLPFGISSDIDTTGLWKAASVTAFYDGFQGFITALDGFSAGSTTLSGFVCISYFSGGVWTLFPSGAYKRIPTKRSSPLVEPVLASSVNAVIGSQRRRNRDI